MSRRDVQEAVIGIGAVLYGLAVLTLFIWAIYLLVRIAEHVGAWPFA